jgi:hypothetical protein
MRTGWFFMVLGRALSLEDNQVGKFLINFAYYSRFSQFYFPILFYLSGSAAQFLLKFKDIDSWMIFLQGLFV